MSRIALVRRPSRRLADGLLTHMERVPVDYQLAVRQWHGYVDAMRAEGWRIVEVPRADEHPDSVFIEDTMVASSELVIMALPGAPSRRGEVAPAEAVVRSLGHAIGRIVAPGTLDGGDILKVGTTWYLGLSLRTNAEAARQLAELLRPSGVRIVKVPLTKVLHLKSAVTALPDGTIVGYEPLVDDVSLFAPFLAVPEESGSHVVILGEHRLLIAADCPETAAVLRSRGYELVQVDISEFQKLEGCVTCLSVRLRGE